MIRDELLESFESALFYNYSIEDESMEDEVMLYYLLSKFLNLDIYSLVEQDDTVFIEG